MEIVDLGIIQAGDRISWRFPSTQGEGHKGQVTKVRGYGESKHFGAPYLDAFIIMDGNGLATYHSIALPLVTHRNGRRVNREYWNDRLPGLNLLDNQEPKYNGGPSQQAMPMTEEDVMALKTHTRKSLDEMSDSHREHIERWDPHMSLLGGEHVWASVKRFPGRGGDGPVYVALKRGAKDYAIMSFDTSKKVKAKVVADGFETSGQVMEAFKEYRQMAKDERAAAKPASKSKSSTTKKKTTTTKASTTKKAPAKKPAAKKAPAKKPVRKK